MEELPAAGEKPEYAVMEARGRERFQRLVKVV